MEVIGRFKIEERIGEGAMADVYRAHDPSIGRTLAIKVLKNEFRNNREIAGRFLREAKAAGALSHPNIVTIYDVGEVDGYPYIAMELLDGEPLDERIRQGGKMPLRQVTRIGAQIAGALDYAHGLGVVHRDIKPSNIMLCSRGTTAKILDFGIARLGEADRVRAELNALRTQVGQVLGTPRYMSPEQALGLEVDYRSDLFSLGVVLYEMVTGKTAFGGTSIATIALQITQQKPEAIDTLLPDCPRGLRAIIDKLLAKQPDKRFKSGADLAAALKREHDALAKEGQGRRRLSLQWRLTLGMGAVTAIALVLSIWTVLDRQHKAMEQMAVTSGASMVRFIANNVAVRAVDNASLPAWEQDWVPVQAFIDAASEDRDLERIVMADARGIVRGASDASLVGRRLAPAGGERILSTEPGLRVSATAAGDFRFDRTIEYAKQPFGHVELVVDGGGFHAAAAGSRNLLLGLGAVLLAVVLVMSIGIAQLLVRPVRRLKAAMIEAARGNLDYRISHHRGDEFGELFERFNALADSIEQRSGATPAPAVDEAALNATRVDMAPAPVSRLEALRHRSV